MNREPAYKTELYLLFEDRAGALHHGRWSTTRELEPGEQVELRERFEQAMAISGHTVLSIQLVSEVETLVEPRRPALRLIRGGAAACSAWFLALCSDDRLDRLILMSA